MHQKCWAMDAFQPAEIGLIQDPIHVQQLTKSRQSDTNIEILLGNIASKLPCLRIGRVELTARWYYKSRTHTKPQRHWSIPSYRFAWTTAKELHSVLRLITNTEKFDHISDQLHWLPICQRVILKIATFVRNSLGDRGPAWFHLIRFCIPISEIGAIAHLRSAALRHLNTLRTRTRRCGPTHVIVSILIVWNSLRMTI